MLSHLTLLLLGFSSIYALPTDSAGISTSALRNASSLQADNSTLVVSGAGWIWGNAMTEKFNELIAYKRLESRGVLVQATALTSTSLGNFEGDPASADSSDLENWRPNFATFAYSQNTRPMTGRYLWNGMSSRLSDHAVSWGYSFETTLSDGDQLTVPVPWPPKLTLTDALKSIKPKFNPTFLVKAATYQANTNGVYWEFDAGPTAEGQWFSLTDSKWRIYENGTTELVYEPPKSKNAAGTITAF